MKKMGKMEHGKQRDEKAGGGGQGERGTWMRVTGEMERHLGGRGRQNEGKRETGGKAG